MGSLGAVGVARSQAAGPCLSETAGVTFRGTFASRGTQRSYAPWSDFYNLINILKRLKGFSWTFCLPDLLV